jgi:hypothetical protein
MHISLVIPENPTQEDLSGIPSSKEYLPNGTVFYSKGIPDLRCAPSGMTGRDRADLRGL